MDLGNIISSASSTASGGIPWGAAISGGLSFLGQSNANQANADLAQQNNAWSAAQYASRYQTQVKDMEAAGLNPMLSYTTGAAGAPSAQTVQFQNALGAGVQSAQAGYTKQAELNQIKASTALTDDQSDKVRQDKEVGKSQERLNDAMVLKTAQDIRTGQANANSANATAALNLQETRMRKLEADIGDKLGVGLKAAVPALSSAASTASRLLKK